MTRITIHFDVAEPLPDRTLHTIRVTMAPWLMALGRHEIQALQVAQREIAPPSERGESPYGDTASNYSGTPNSCPPTERLTKPGGSRPRHETEDGA